ncbi:XdhC family protein [Flavobacterium aquicola]|uniref:Xanthine/CO dehydrogenase XdhC/CoxF family maturation factor n=1 Tax=Flavobacterium aquicola TaxID=1682742 RepID=A0A3E0EPV4_9FLAO|nr:XdhC/CoxI family protein [Flavobacterium aquicola]REG99750.1 xanthine/CO dehydrogenase XdhC/CoxF family maturation factor [Flavobacterium aquicola]
MTHEFLKIIESCKRARQKNIRTVLATIVHTEGSSYRKEGTQMLIDEYENITGALSGGCVEQEVIRQSISVFASDCPKVFKYDGRFRLGCEGSIYILIEMFQLDDELLQQIEQAIEQRQPFSLSSSFLAEEINQPNFGTSFEFKDIKIYHSNYDKVSNNLVFKQQIQPLNRLCIFGIEHDAEKLSQMASFLGWEVIVIGSEYSTVNGSDFPFAKSVLTMKPEDLDPNLFCKNTAVVVMSHNFSKDLRFLLTMITSKVKYIGLLGPAHRREKLLNAILDTDLFIDDEAFDKIHGPVGLPIGSQTPEEIALSIMAEITSIWRSTNQKQTEFACFSSEKGL